MANIMLNDVCNLQCSYCFANDLIKRNEKNISMSNFIAAVDFILTSKTEERIGIIGGEPTLHPEFSKILQYLIDNEKVNEVIIFTNGILIDKYYNHLSDPKFFLLINCNSQKDIGVDNYENLKRNIRKLNEEYKMKERITLGLNIYEGMNNPEFIFDLLEENNFDKLRISIAAPNFEIEEEFDQLSYYESLKGITMEIVFTALEKGIQPFFDCNQLPMCLITNEERKKMLMLKRGNISNVLSLKSVCEPVIDISPNLSAVRCMGLSDFLTVNIGDFNSLDDLRDFFVYSIDDYKNIVSKDKKCKECYYNKIKRCSSGCLCYKKKSIKKAIELINS